MKLSICHGGLHERIMWYCDATKENVSIIHARILTVSHMMTQGVINSNQKEIKHTLTRSHTYTFDVHYLCDYLLLCFIQPHSHTTVKMQFVQFSKYRMIHLYTERLRHRKWVTLKGISFFILIFYFIFLPYLYLCIFSCFCIPYKCTVHGADLTYISLLIIFCITVYVTNENHEYLESWMRVYTEALKGQYRIT